MKMNKLKNLLQRIDEVVGTIPLDYTLHVICSGFIAGVIMMITGACGCTLLQSLLLSLLVTIMIGIFKEVIIDTLIKGKEVDDQDISADVVGADLAVFLIVCNILIFR